MALMTGPLSPYVTPEQLVAAPTGLDFSTIPAPQSTPAENYAELVNICRRSTGMCDTAANQSLRATVQTETLYGPDFRVNQLPSGNTRLLLSQWPITQVTAVRVAAAAVFPRQWVNVVTGAWAIERPTLSVYGSSAPVDSGTGGQSVLLGPGYVNWWNNRGGYAIETTYVSGWPHCGLTANATAGSATLSVDDCTGWGPAAPGDNGATGVVHDTAGTQEAVTVLAASAAAGPGTLTLSAGLSYAHDAGIILTTLPDQVQWAAILFACSQALTRGATATAIQAIGGRVQTDGKKAAKGYEDQACEELRAFRRVI